MAAGLPLDSPSSPKQAGGANASFAERILIRRGGIVAGQGPPYRSDGSEQLTDSVPFETEGVRGFLHRPDGTARGGLVLTHGAGGNCNAPLLVAAATAFCVAGLAVLR